MPKQLVILSDGRLDAIGALLDKEAKVERRHPVTLLRERLRAFERLAQEKRRDLEDRAILRPENAEIRPIEQAEAEGMQRVIRMLHREFPEVFRRR